MQPFGPPDCHYFNAAMGWLGLGNVAEARAELAQLSPGLRNEPEVLELRWLLCVEEQNWTDALQVARELLHRAPERASGWLHQAYALRRVPEGNLLKAWDALLPAFEKFPKEAIIPYNLSCYACQMQRLAEARIWFRRALHLGDREHIKRMGLADPDLEPLWPEIRDY